MKNSSPTVQTRLNEISFVFFKLGSVAFGGPAAHIAMMEEELVRRRKWISQNDFLDMIGAANLIPGPNSTEIAIHVGHKMGGWRGLILAGVSFIIPAFLIVWVLAWFYVKFGSIPAFQSVFLGIKPVILAVIVQAICSLARNAIKDKILAVLCGLSLLIYLAGYNEILILFSIALANLIFRTQISSSHFKIFFPGILSLILFTHLSKALAQIEKISAVPIETLFSFFLKTGSVLFGSGYVLIAFLQNDLVDRYHWITQQQLLDAIAIGQFTPGPVFTTATFIGYLVSGHYGAIAATVGIFLPAFFFVALSAPLLPALRKWRWTASILDGLNVASLSLMIGACLLLAKGTLFSFYGAIVFLLCLTLMMKYKVNSAWLILAAGLLGALDMVG